MFSKKLVFIYGFMMWFVPFAVAFLVFFIHESNRPLFESIMAVAVTGSTVLFTMLYFKKTEGNYLKQGIMIGVIWFLISFVIDLFMTSAGPMEMSFGEYISDIAVTYLIMPIVTIGFGFLLENKA